MQVYWRQVEAFRRKFGREMGPEDPFFFDPNHPTPEFRSPGEAQYAMDVLVELMLEAGIDQGTIYAFKSTGGLFPDATVPFSAAQQCEWNAAIQQYEDQLRLVPRQ